LHLLKALRLCCHEVIVLCYFEYESEIVSEYRKEGSEVRLLELDRKINSLQFIRKLIKEIRQVKPEIVHIQYLTPGALPIIAARLSGIKRVFATIHYPYSQWHSMIAKLIVRFSSILTTRFICVSQNAEQSWFGKSFLFDENVSLNELSNHFTIYNTVDTGRITALILKSDKSKLKKILNIYDDTFVIGTVSRLSYEKGVDILIDSFISMLKLLQKIHLLVIGDGQDREHLIKKVLENGIQNSVTFYGRTEWSTAIQMIGLMDIVVVPSRYEGFGLVALEAMAAGKPVVASNSFGLNEVVKNEETGLFFNSDDSKMLESKIIRLYNDRTLREVLGANGQIRCGSIFGVLQFREKIELLYNQGY